MERPLVIAAAKIKALLLKRGDVLVHRSKRGVSLHALADFPQSLAHNRAWSQRQPGSSSTSFCRLGQGHGRSLQFRSREIHGHCNHLRRKEKAKCQAELIVNVRF